MARKITVQARRELVDAIGTRYRGAARCDKLRILDEFVAVTGYHRKHAIRMLNEAGAAGESPEPRVRSQGRVYDDAVREALIVLWEAADRVCGKRLKPLLPILLQALERHGHVHLDDTVRTRVLSVSAATIDRVLAPTRAAVNGGNRAARRAKPAIGRFCPFTLRNGCSSVKGQNPLSNRACGFPAHGLPMVFVTEHARRGGRPGVARARERHLASVWPCVASTSPAARLLPIARVEVLALERRTYVRRGR
jgi:hypothetical protein